MQKNKEPLKPYEMKKVDEGRIVELTWNENCNNLLDERYTQMMDEVNRELKKLEPGKLLVDLHHCQYIVTPDVLKWHDHTLFDLFGQSNPDALAFVVPSNLFNHIFFEATQVAEETENTNVQYFRERDKALEWLRKA